MTVFADYEHTMTVSGGNGKINGLPGKITSAEAMTVDPNSNKIKVNDTELTVTPPDSDHFVIGLKDAGHDNANTELLTGKVSLADRNEDTHLVVAYGLKSNMVEYTVRYVDVNTGAELLAAETHYGVDGSKPVVSYKYVDGHLPDAYNRTGTITKGGTNEFTFYYYEVDAEGNVITVNDVVGGAGAGAAGAGAGAANAGAPGAVVGDNAVPLADGQPQDVVDLDTPTTDQADNGTDVEGTETPKAGLSTPVKIAGAAAIIAAIAAVVAAIARKNAGGDDDDDDEDDDE